MNLYFVQHNDDMGENLDLMVEAETVERSIELWRVYYWDDENDESLPERVFLVKPLGTEGVIAWNTHHMEMVHDAR